MMHFQYDLSEIVWAFVCPQFYLHMADRGGTCMPWLWCFTASLHCLGGATFAQLLLYIYFMLRGSRIWHNFFFFQLSPQLDWSMLGPWCFAGPMLSNDLFIAKNFQNKAIGGNRCCPRWTASGWCHWGSYFDIYLYYLCHNSSVF